MKNSRSDHAFPVSADSNSDSNGRVDLKPAGKSRSIPTPPPSSPNTGQPSSDSPTSQPFPTLPGLTLFVGDSPAKTSRWLVPAPDSKESEALSGPNSSDSFAKLAPDGLWLKTYQGCSQAMTDGSWETFSETWPQSGSMRNGECFLLVPSAHHIHAKGCSSWPTPTASDWKEVGLLRRIANHWLLRNCNQLRPQHKFAAKFGAKAPVALWEWLMGFEIGRTALDASETPSSRKSRKGSAK